MRTIPFTKMHGAGNDYVYIDCFRNPTPNNPAELARQISDRHRGVGGDGLILICPDEQSDARMRMFNADGSEAEMCGNGIRCVAKYLFDHGLVPRETIRVATGAGILTLNLTVEHGLATKIRVDLGEPILDGLKIPTTFGQTPVVDQVIKIGETELTVTCVSMGNPHCVVFVEELNDEIVLGLGPKIERSPYFPARVNVEFVKKVTEHELIQRTWERGSGETQACGTGAAAVCVAGVLSGRSQRQVVVHLLGGDLELDWDEASNHVFKTGPATEVFSGLWPIEFN